MPPEHDPERRQFYRIEDRVGLECRQIEGEPTGSPETLFEGGETLPLEEELRRHDADVRHHLGMLSENDRVLYQLARALNDKLDTVARIMTFQQNPLQDSEWANVTLSEGGLSYTAGSPAPPLQTILALRLTLMPELSQVSTYARVIAVDELAEGVQLHLQFHNLEDAERQKIARHVLRIQARERQRARQRRELGDEAE